MQEFSRFGRFLLKYFVNEKKTPNFLAPSECIFEFNENLSSSFVIMLYQQKLKNIDISMTRVSLKHQVKSSTTFLC